MSPLRVFRICHATCQCKSAPHRYVGPFGWQGGELMGSYRLRAHDKMPSFYQDTKDIPDVSIRSREFGYHTLDTLTRDFTREDRRRLHKAGFIIRVYTAPPGTFLCGVSQVVFNQKVAECVDSMPIPHR